jgi:hypothetical protein
MILTGAALYMTFKPNQTKPDRHQRGAGRGEVFYASQSIRHAPCRGAEWPAQKSYRGLFIPQQELEPPSWYLRNAHADHRLR